MESSIFDAIGIDPGIIIIFVLGVLLIVLIYMIKISMKMSRFMKKYKMFMRRHGWRFPGTRFCGPV